MPKCEVKSVAKQRNTTDEASARTLHTAGLNYHIIIHGEVMSMIIIMIIMYIEPLFFANISSSLLARTLSFVHCASEVLRNGVKN